MYKKKEPRTFAMKKLYKVYHDDTWDLMDVNPFSEDIWMGDDDLVSANVYEISESIKGVAIYKKTKIIIMCIMSVRWVYVDMYAVDE